MNSQSQTGSGNIWDAGGADLTALHKALLQVDGYADVSLEDLDPLRTKGLVHAHVRVRGTGTVLRIPRLGSFGLAPGDNLLYQETCFRRASPSGHVPELRGKIPPGDGIPWGALVISEIDGVTPPMPDGLPAIARALAAIHSLPVPPPEDRAPLPSHDDPVPRTLAVIEAQAAFLPDAGIDRRTRKMLEEELDSARAFVASVSGADVPVALAGTDTHPGNFMMRNDGTAIFVDLEKTLYGAPAIDLAHATVYTSTMWDADVAIELSNDAVRDFYRAYFAAIPPDLAARIRPWCQPLRRFTWLRTTTWCAKWRVESQNGAAWSVAHHDPAYIDAVRQRVDDYFNPETVERVRAGFDVDVIDG